MKHVNNCQRAKNTVGARHRNGQRNVGWGSEALKLILVGPAKQRRNEGALGP
jgi:hypothetical protein